MLVSELTGQYGEKIRLLQIGLDEARSQSAIATGALLLTIALLLILGVSAIRKQAPFYMPLLMVPAIAVAARRMRSQRLEADRTWRLRGHYERALQRMNGEWIGNGSNGLEFDYPNHIYSNDLNVLGDGSLFELLCTARTSIGRRGLAGYLLSAPAMDETRKRQEAVKELRDQQQLREELAVLGKFDFNESSWETFASWLNSPELTYSNWVRAAVFASSILIVALVAAGFLGLVPWRGVQNLATPLLAFHAAVGLHYRDRVKQMIGWLGPISVETQVLREGLHLMENQPFQSAKLAGLAGKAKGGSAALKHLERLLAAVSERNKDWFYGPSVILLVGTQLCWAIENWRTQHGVALRIWLEAWAEFEALNSLANYAYENSSNSFPEFSDPPMFEAKELGHPLLPAEGCVRNDIELNGRSRFYLVSGSNMSGKSTLLRAIGLNAVLAFAGAPVRAGALRLSRLSIGASLSVADSLLNGKSKFMAEVDRLRQILDAASADAPVLFLVDEIFAGTNSRDRRVASEAVVRTLIGRGAIGALSTHDLALTEIAVVPEWGGVNVHTGSRDGGDPMDFDYRLKPGITNETNALAIARLAGVPV